MAKEFRKQRIRQGTATRRPDDMCRSLYAAGFDKGSDRGKTGSR